MSYNPNYTGSTLKIPSNSVGDVLPNSTGLDLDPLVPVRSDSNGDIATVNVSVEAEALSCIGITVKTIVNGESGEVIGNGRIENITTTAGFGDTLYISKNEDLTNVKPTIGANGFLAGDFVIFIGTVIKNKDNPLNKDLIINLTTIGQL